jgi:hypothetical protein
VRISGSGLGGDQFGQCCGLLDGRGRVVYGLQFEHGALGELAAVAGFPFVVLLDEGGGGKAEEGGGVGEHSNDVGAGV